MTTFDVVFGSDITFLPDRNTWDFWTSDSILLYHMYVALPDLGPHSPASECRHASSMRPKARGLAQRRRPAWLAGGSVPAGFDFVRDRRSMLPALTNGQKYLSRSGADLLLLNVHETPSWAMSRKEGMAWYSSKPMPSLWASYTFRE